jgi:hypothetical protein
MTFNVTTEYTFYTMKVFINGILHLLIRPKDFVGLHAYQEEQSFVIEVHTIHRMIMVEYDSREKWVAVLSELNSIFT